MLDEKGDDALSMQDKDLEAGLDSKNELDGEPESPVDDAASPTSKEVEVNDPPIQSDVEAANQTPDGFQSAFNLPVWKKWLMTFFMSFMTFTVTFGSSTFSATIPVTSEEFNVSDTIMILGVSLYVLGFALAPVVWGPLSELVGRKWPLFGGYALFALMQIPTALSTNLPGVLISRCLAGCFGASPIVIVSASYADFWEPAERASATALYSAACYIGPTMGPIIGSFVTESYLGWRWTAWFTLIMAAAFGIPAWFIVPETYAPVLRARAAKGTAGATAPKFQAGTYIRKYLVKPIQMLGTEMMLDIVSVYVALVYGIMYLTFYAFPFTFRTERGWSNSISTLPFISVLVGVLITCAFFAYYMQKVYAARLKARRGRVIPEDRLPPMMVGAVLMPAGLFWFAWTASPEVSWVAQVISGAFIGSGVMLIFSGGVVFLVDIYLDASASALAANTMIRSMAACGLPLAAPSMYQTLGVQWATSLLGFLCLILMPAPFLFHRYGARLRRISKFAVTR